MDELTITSDLVSGGVDFSLFSLFLRADLVVKVGYNNSNCIFYLFMDNNS